MEVMSAGPRDYLIHADVYRSVISSAIQAKWICKSQALGSGADHDPYMSGPRMECISDMVDLINRVAGKPYADSMAEDFHYWLCRPAFHALCCGDLTHLREILALHFGFSPIKLAPHVERGRNLILQKRAPNTQWMFLLYTVSEMLKGKTAQARAEQIYHDLFKDRGSGELSIKSPTISRAAADVAIGLRHNPFEIAERNLINKFWPIPDVEGNFSYYHLIRSAALGL